MPRTLTRQGNSEPGLRTLYCAREFTSQVNFNDYEAAFTTFRQAYAFLDLDEGELIMPKEGSVVVVR